MNAENNDDRKMDGGKISIGGATSGKAGDQKTSAPVKAAEKPTEQAPIREGSPQPEVQAPGAPHLHPLTADIRRRWANFADSDLKNVKTREDLSAAVSVKYGISAELANTQVKEWAVGRQF